VRVGTRREGGFAVSIVRVGLAETRNFAEGYEAIFGNKGARTQPDEPGAGAKKPRARAARKPKAAARARGRSRKPAKKARK
jgi:hypothetical protein